jgi:hypothetical protein
MRFANDLPSRLVIGPDTSSAQPQGFADLVRTAMTDPARTHVNCGPRISGSSRQPSFYRLRPWPGRIALEGHHHVQKSAPNATKTGHQVRSPAEKDGAGKDPGEAAQLHGAYFLAEGDRSKLDAVFAQVEKDYGKPVFGARGKKFDPVPDKPVPAEVVAAWKNLPRASEVKDK